MAHTPQRLTGTTDLLRLRRLALQAQGLLQQQPFGRGLTGARRAIGHLGYVQIDTISVVERAHHHVLRARVPNFTPSMTQQLLLDGSIFEYWSHAAALLPMEDYRFSLHYKRMVRSGQSHWIRSRDRKLMADLKRRIRDEGPLRSRDIETKPLRKGAGWWDWKPAKRALEQLFMEGDLMVKDRQGFQKTYDLTHRVLPQWVNTEVPTVDALAEHLLDQQLRCHAMVTLKGLTYLRRDPALRHAMLSCVQAHQASGALEVVQLDSGEQLYGRAGFLDQRIPRPSNALRILSPFDNVLIQRPRLKSLFGYDYQIECYVPAAKRRFGYFCLPLLYRDHFVGLVDCKAHRGTGVLELKHVHITHHHFDSHAVLEAFVTRLGDFAAFQECASIEVTAVSPKRLHQPLNNLLSDLRIT